MQISPDVTQLLIDWNGGDRNALEQLMPLVYRELQLIAHRHLRREAQNHILQTTAFVHEAYMKLVDQTRMKRNWLADNSRFRIKFLPFCVFVVSRRSG